MFNLTFRIAGALALAAPLIAGACGVSQPNANTLVVESSTAGCKMSAQDLARYRVQLSQALAALPGESKTLPAARPARPKPAPQRQEPARAQSHASAPQLGAVPQKSTVSPTRFANHERLVTVASL